MSTQSSRESSSAQLTPSAQSSTIGVEDSTASVGGTMVCAPSSEVMQMMENVTLQLAAMSDKVSELEAASGANTAQALENTTIFARQQEQIESPKAQNVKYEGAVAMHQAELNNVQRVLKLLEASQQSQMTVIGNQSEQLTEQARSADVQAGSASEDLSNERKRVDALLEQTKQSQDAAVDAKMASLAADRTTKFDGAQLSAEEARREASDLGESVDSHRTQMRTCLSQVADVEAAQRDEAARCRNLEARSGSVEESMMRVEQDMMAKTAAVEGSIKKGEAETLRIVSTILSSDPNTLTDHRRKAGATWKRGDDYGIKIGNAVPKVVTAKMFCALAGRIDKCTKQLLPNPEAKVREVANELDTTTEKQRQGETAHCLGLLAPRSEITESREKASQLREDHDALSQRILTEAVERTDRAH